MAQPQLTADVPIAKAAQPIEIRALVALGVPPHLPRLGRGEGLVAHGLHAQPPLLADQRLDDCVASVAVADLVRVGLLPDEKALRLQVLDHALARLECGEAVVGEAGHVHAAVGVHPVDDLEPVPLADVVVHRVVARRDLERARAEILFHRVVSDDGQLATDQRKHRGLTDLVLVTIVRRVHRDAGVGEHRLGAHRGDDHLAPALNRIADAVEHVVVLLPLDLEVGDGRAVVGAPVHDPRRSIDPTPVVEGDERGHDRAVVAGVHREAQPAPVHRGAEDAQLVDDRRADLLVPGFDARVETLPPQLLFRHALPCQLVLDHVLRRDRGVVVTRQEEHLVAGHPLVAGDEVVDGGLEGVAHVQLARDVGRREAHGELRQVARCVGEEELVLLPARVPAGLDGLWIELLRHPGFCHLSSCMWACFIGLERSDSPARRSRLARLSRRGYGYDVFDAAHGALNLSGRAA